MPSEGNRVTSPLTDIASTDAKGKGSRRVEYTRATVLQSAADDEPRADYVAMAWAKIRGLAVPVRGAAAVVERGSAGVSLPPYFSEGENQ